MAPFRSLSTSATRAARKAPEKELISTGPAGVSLAKAGWLASAMPATARPASQFLLVSGVTSLPAMKRRSASGLRSDHDRPKHGLFGVAVQPARGHNAVTGHPSRFRLTKHCPVREPVQFRPKPSTA